MEKASHKTNIGRIALTVGVIFFISVITIYAVNFFENPISGNPEHWGVLGDFVGGIVNPLLGLVTIWLLTVSLQQNNEMLEQARMELKATLEELKRGQKIQAATEQALESQIEIAKSARDMDGVVKLISYWQAKHDTLLSVGKDEVEHARMSNYSKEHVEQIRNDYNSLATSALEKIRKLDHILALEEARLMKNYPIESAIYK